MHDAGRGVGLLQAADQAVMVARVTAGYAQQQVGFAHQQQVFVLVEDLDRLAAVGHQVGCGFDMHGEQW